MKHFDNTDDMELSRLLKEQLPEAGRNEWFTRKVMNRLPEKQQRSFGWLLPLAFTVSIILCLVGWVYFLHNLNLEIILVRDVVTLATLFATTVVVMWQFLHTLSSSPTDHSHLLQVATRSYQAISSPMIYPPEIIMQREHNAHSA